ncbi:Tripeptidyl-Peptidase 2 [Manis pentadactyla]|nr:Tripeptidyl-Peptidase 2 [Manis pentadactyla]
MLIFSLMSSFVSDQMSLHLTSKVADELLLSGPPARWVKQKKRKATPAETSGPEIKKCCSSHSFFLTTSCVLGGTQAGVVLAVVRIAKFLHPELILADFSKRSSAPFHQYTSSLKQCLYDLAENNPISEFRVISGHCRCYCYYNCPLSNQRKFPESFFTASIPSAKPFFFLLRTRPND